MESPSECFSLEWQWSILYASVPDVEFMAGEWHTTAEVGKRGFETICNSFFCALKFVYVQALVCWRVASWFNRFVTRWLPAECQTHPLPPTQVSLLRLARPSPWQCAASDGAVVMVLSHIHTLFLHCMPLASSAAAQGFRYSPRCLR